MLQKKRNLMFPAVVAFLVFAFISKAYAASVLFIADSSGNLGYVNQSTGEVTVTGNMGVAMTDIAFTPSGDLYGLSFDNIYTIDAHTGAATLIGSHGISGGNALEFSSDGGLYAAGGSTTSIYSINLATGKATDIGDIGFSSSGDLVVHNGRAFMSSTTDELVEITIAGNNLTSGILQGTAIGKFGLPSVFGLASSGNDDILYGFSGTTLLSIDPDTGIATSVLDYSGKGLDVAYGSGFGPPLPIPGGIWLLSSGLLALLGIKRRIQDGQYVKNNR